MAEEVVLVADEPIVTLTDAQDDDIALYFDEPRSQGKYWMRGKEIDMIYSDHCKTCTTLVDKPQLRTEVDVRLFMGQSAGSIHRKLPPEIARQFSYMSLTRHRDRGHLPDLSEGINATRERTREQMRRTLGHVVELDVQRKSILAQEMERFEQWLEMNPEEVPDRRQNIQYLRLSQREDVRDNEQMRRLLAESRATARAFAEMMVAVVRDHRDLAPEFRQYIDEDEFLRRFFGKLQEDAAIEASSQEGSPQPSLSSSSVSE